MITEIEETLIKTPEDEIADNGFYLFNSETGSIFLRILLILDILIYGTIYLLVGLGTSYILNRFVTSDKNLTSQPKAKVFGEIIGEVLFTIIGLYIAILFLGKIPSIVIYYTSSKIPKVHKVIRYWAGSIILIFSIIVLQTKLTRKILFVFN